MKSNRSKKSYSLNTNSRPTKSKWSRYYSQRHKYVPILDDPLLPDSRRGRVRIYRRGVRNGHNTERFILNWYEDGKNCKYSITGDKFTAVAKADQINNRLALLGNSDLTYRRISITALMDLYVKDLEKRADAKEISPRSVTRYKNALHYICRFANECKHVSQVSATKIDEHFILCLKSYLHSLQISPNGHPNTQPKPMTETGVRYIISVFRALWNWAQHHNSQLLPKCAQNPFRKHVGSRQPKELVGRSALDVESIVKLIKNADIYQLIILMPFILYGLRASEPCYLMIEDWRQDERILTVNCIPDLDYKTKGRVSKTLPVPPVINQLLSLIVADRTGGPLLISRNHFENRRKVSQKLTAKQQIIEQYRRCTDQYNSAGKKMKVLEKIMRQAGAVSYNQLCNEFKRMVKVSQLSTYPTLKSLRHYFASSMEKANISYFTRKYLMGHRIVRDPLAIYTTTDYEGIRCEFNRLLEGPMATIITEAQIRIEGLGIV